MVFLTTVKYLGNYNTNLICKRTIIIKDPTFLQISFHLHQRLLNTLYVFSGYVV